VKKLRWEYLKRALDLLVIVSIIFAGIQLSNSWKVDSAKFIYEIGKDLNNNAFDKITSAIDDNKSTFKLLKPDGEFSPNDIETYLNGYDFVGNLNNDNLVDMRLAYDEFSYDVEKAFCNNDIRQHIRDLRSKDKDKTGPNSFYWGFTTLAEQFLKRDNKTCVDLDKQ